MRFCFVAISIISFLLSDTLPALAQTARLPLDGYTIKNIRRLIYSPFIVSQGQYLWYGTDRGLVRRDSETGAERRFTTADGLPSNTVKCAAVSPDGSVWVGTAGGAGRYDGNVWKKYTTADGLAHNDITSIAAAPNGDVWVGISISSGELCRFDGATWRTYAARDGLTVPGVSCSRPGQALAFAPDGAVWTSMTWTEGSFLEGVHAVSAVFSFNGKEWKLHGTFPERDIRALAVGADGKIRAGSVGYAGSGAGLMVYDGVSWENDLLFPKGAGPGRLKFSPDGALWACAEEYLDWENGNKIGGGIYRLDGTTWRNYSIKEGMVSYTALDIAFAPDGAAWAATPEGICRQKGEAWETVAGIEGPVSNAITSLAVDARGTFWVGSAAGISGFDGTTWKIHEPRVMEEVACIGADKNGIVWAGLGGGKNLWQYDGRAWKRIGQGDGLKLSRTYSVLALAFTSGSEMVFSMYDYDLDRDAPWKIVFQYPGSWLITTSAAGEIVSMAVASTGALWYASPWHLFRYESGEGKTYAAGEDFPGAEINTVVCAPDNRIWVGTDKGASVFDNGQWKSWSTAEGLIGADVRTIAFDPSGRVWFGTYGGVSVYDGQTWQYLTASGGLADNSVTAVAFDPEGTVWIGTGNGVTRLIPGEVSVKSDSSIPKPFAIQGNYPNPFNPSTTISFTLPEAGEVSLAIYSITGQKVRELLSDDWSYRPYKPYTPYNIIWDGCDDSGKPVSSGVYIARLQAGKTVAGRKMLLVR
ncbi:MAG: ligand-binding sensor domain-containing protein [Candidatus Latescibacterota bacterium]